MYYICAINDDGGMVGQLYAKDTAAFDAFAKAHNKKGVSVYDCVAPLRPDASSRCVDTVARIECLHVDIDLRALTTPRDAVLAKLQELSEVLPLELRDSGGGFHAIARLKEPAASGTSEFEKANLVRAALTKMLCGDAAPNHAAALLRRPGTINWKYGEPRECQIIKEGAPVDLISIDAFVDLYGGKPQFQWKPDAQPSEKPEKPNGKVNGFDDDSPHAVLNDVAIKNLSAWVPELLPDAKRNPGRGAAYKIRAFMRPSKSGTPDAQRKLNLSIHPKGITDYGAPGGPKGYSPLDLVMAARSCDLSEAFDWLEMRVMKESSDIEIDLEKIVESQEAPKTSPDQDEEPKSQFKGYDIKPYRVLRGCETEPRDWVAYKHYLRGTVSTTVGPGAGGKTSLDMVEAYSMALGRDLLGQCTIARPYRVWYHNAEETMKELDRRFAALREHYGIEEGAEGDRLFVTCGFDLRIRATDRGKKLDMDTYHRILHTIQERGHEVAVFDPLTAMHNREETNDGLGELMYDFFGPIANITRTAIEIVHHTRKGPPGTEIDYSAIDARGGGAFIFAVRSGRVVNGMKKAEAEAYYIEEGDRFSYFRVGRDKPNMVKRGLLGWYKIESQILANARPDEGRDNEDVGVVTSWTPPEASDPAAMYGQAEKDHWRELAANDPTYGYHANSKHWFGEEIAKRLKLDLILKGAKKNKKIVTAILDDLIEDGTLRVVTRKGDDRHDRQFVGPGNAT